MMVNLSPGEPTEGSGTGGLPAALAVIALVRRIDLMVTVPQSSVRASASATLESHRSSAPVSTPPGVYRAVASTVISSGAGKRAAARQHHTQVMPEQVTRAFQDAREAAGIKGGNPPSSHEIRSLGGALLSESGWAIEQV